MKTSTEILSEYWRRVEELKAAKSAHKEIRKLSTQDILLFRAIVHPTDRKESKDITCTLIKFLCDEGIVTAQQIYQKYGWSDNPVMRRIKVMKEFGMIRRESKRYYIATPRLVELRQKYLDRICN